MTAIFLTLKDQKCLFQFSFFFFTFGFKWNQSRYTEIKFNFQFSLLDENRMDERYTHQDSLTSDQLSDFRHAVIMRLNYTYGNQQLKNNFETNGAP